MVVGSSSQRGINNAIWLKSNWTFESTGNTYDTMWRLVNRKNDSVLVYKNFTILKYKSKYHVIEELNDSNFISYRYKSIYKFLKEKEIPDSLKFISIK